MFGQLVKMGTNQPSCGGAHIRKKPVATPFNEGDLVSLALIIDDFNINRPSR